MSDHVCVVTLRLQRGPEGHPFTLSLLNTHSHGPNTLQGWGKSSEQRAIPAVELRTSARRQTINQSVRPPAHQLVVSALEKRKQGSMNEFLRERRDEP